MTDLITKALEGIRAVGPAEELLALAKSKRGGVAVKANTHVHLPPNFSAFRDGAQAVDLAAQRGPQLPRREQLLQLRGIRAVCGRGGGEGHLSALRRGDHRVPGRPRARGRQDQRPRQPRQDVPLRQGHFPVRDDDRRGGANTRASSAATTRSAWRRWSRLMD